jgi:hypothetical protein
MPSSYIRAIVKHVLHERPLCSSCTFLSVIVDSVGGFGLQTREIANNNRKLNRHYLAWNKMRVRPFF